MTLIIPVTCMPASAFSWGLDHGESSGYEEQKELLEASVLTRGELSKVFLTQRQLGAGLGQSVGAAR